MAPELLDSGDNDDTNFSPTLSKETDVYAFAMVGLEVSLFPSCLSRCIGVSKSHPAYAYGYGRL